MKIQIPTADTMTLAPSLLTALEKIGTEPETVNDQALALRDVTDGLFETMHGGALPPSREAALAGFGTLTHEQMEKLANACTSVTIMLVSVMKLLDTAHANFHALKGQDFKH